MKYPTLSVIIIAANEEKYIERALVSIKKQNYKDYEIIVVVNGSTDETEAIARTYTSHVLVYKKLLGYSGARNVGAYQAKGRMLVFLDADSFIEQGVLEHIAKRNAPLVFGTVLGKPDNPRFIFRLFLGFKNFVHVLRIYKGVLGGLMFCSTSLFKKIHGFNVDKIVDENNDFSIRARKAGGTYLLFTSVYAVTSMRRFEREGIRKMLYFWFRIWFLRFRKQEDSVFKEYKLNI